VPPPRRPTPDRDDAAILAALRVETAVFLDMKIGFGRKIGRG
jgi:hypothetical protein